MDVLDKYKKAWVNQPEDNRQLSSKEIYKLAHSSSSSLVKWIFIIGILEFIFWGVINFLVPDSFYKVYKDLNLETFLQIFTVFHYIILIAFLYLFYQNYTNISLVDNTKKLIKKILKVRKTVNYYVYYNLAIIVLVSFVINAKIFSNPKKHLDIINPDNLAMDLSQIVTISIISQIIAVIVILVLFWLFYKLIYGIFLRKLNKNYKELSKLDESN